MVDQSQAVGAGRSDRRGRLPLRGFLPALPVTLPLARHRVVRRKVEELVVVFLISVAPPILSPRTLVGVTHQIGSGDVVMRPKLGAPQP